jgi:hypothetical protein
MRSNVIVLIVTLLAIVLAQHRGFAQVEPNRPDVTIKFKIFDANQPTTNYPPQSSGTVQYRIIGETRFDDPRNVTISGPDGQGLYSVQVSHGRVINRLTIVVDGASINPAVLSKVVASGDMTVYLGASDSLHEFSFPGFMAQMGEYRDLHEEFAEGSSSSQVRLVNLNALRALFTVQLTNMSDVRARLPHATRDQLAAAQKLASDVLRRYGFPTSEATDLEKGAASKACPCSPSRSRMKHKCRWRCR